VVYLFVDVQAQQDASTQDKDNFHMYEKIYFSKPFLIYSNNAEKVSSYLNMNSFFTCLSPRENYTDIVTAACWQS
jgi:hypothetical protein